jgi:nanoRNase/pAp phosphatase (c-di-AMP/oligoRNAs hydrolase)
LRSREPDPSVERGRAKLAQLLKVAEGKRTLLAQTHDFPDPDSMASAMALTWMLKELAGVDGEIGYGGIIGRAENRAMIKSLGVKMHKTAPDDFGRYDLVALLDTQPHVGNHSIPADRMPDIVVDHHFPRALSDGRPAYFDVGGAFGTTSTKVTELVRASGLTPPPEVATALFYGVKSDTMNLARVTTPADVSAYLYLFSLADRHLMAEIEHPQVPLDYFRVFNKAIERGRIYGSMIVADLGEVYTPDLCAELADRLLQVEGMKHALATGWYEGSLFLSLRTRSRSKNAGKILHAIVAKGGLGTAGGHGPMGGARVAVEKKTPRAANEIRRRVISQILAAFGEESRHFQRIVSAPRASSTTARPSAAQPRTNGESQQPTSRAASQSGARERATSRPSP